jgi:acyl-lipid omega-6 desaturase (Delta-12 desaturase)
MFSSIHPPDVALPHEASPGVDLAVPGGDPLHASRPFAVANDGVATRQIVGTLAGVVALVTMMALAPGLWGFAAAPLLAGFLVRVFVLQHDAGHGSLFSSRSANDRAGLLLSWLTGVPFRPWLTEHNWHHANQGRLDRRGVDRVNSPMTVLEAAADPKGASLRSRLISPVTVFVLGAWSLIGKRKRLAGFFPFRPGFPGPHPDLVAQRAGLYATLLPYIGFQVVFALALGPRVWLAWAVASCLGAGLGAWLFWLQHNFEHTLHAPDTTWDYTDVALHGSSYLALGRLGSWFTASIGLHHVHHLNPRIPNYRLEEARRAIPELAAVAPLTTTDLAHSFTHVFWDEAAGKMSRGA